MGYLIQIVRYLWERIVNVGEIIKLSEKMRKKKLSGKDK
ncbi:hypothetical protein ECDEC6B_2365 [Escherichia coli DEC6B]|nr:hypothetical protein ECDEC6B_2365 [Escherichia coli DEC6B]